MNTKQDNNKKWAEIVAKAWIDEKFKKQLLANPTKVLKEEGISFSTAGGHCKIVENTHDTHYFILPMKPEGNLSEYELKKVAAAGPYQEQCSAGTMACR